MVFGSCSVSTKPHCCSLETLLRLQDGLLAMYVTTGQMIQHKSIEQTGQAGTWNQQVVIHHPGNK